MIAGGHVQRPSATSATVQLDPRRPAVGSAPTSTAAGDVGQVMSDAGLAIARQLAVGLEALAELSKHDPAAADQIVGSLVAHLRAFRPESVSPLGTMPPPGEVARDPRRPR